MKPVFTRAEMIARLREMASQILSPQSEGKRFFEAVANELECVSGNSDATPHLDAPKYFYFVDGEKFDSAKNTSGSIIKSRLPDAKRKFALYVEGSSGQPDSLIEDDTTLEFGLEKDSNRFYTVPPATFGAYHCQKFPGIFHPDDLEKP